MNKKNTQSAISIVFVLFILSSVLAAAATGKMEALTKASFDSAKASVTLAIGLIGIMALWLGLVRILEAGGLMRTLARLVRPVFVRLFPEVPAQHPAMGAMLLNVSANMLGLGNAATPFGIKAMVELKKLKPNSRFASNAMCLFLAINTSSVTILPLGVIGVRAAANCYDPAGIFWPTIIATTCSTLVAVCSCLLFSRLDRRNVDQPEESEDLQLSKREEADAKEVKEEDYSHLLTSSSRVLKSASILAMSSFAFFFLMRLFQATSEKENGILFFLKEEFAAHWLMPGLMFFMLAYGLYRGVKVYEAVTEGAKQGFDIAVRIIPYLVAILVAIGMFRASGGIDYISLKLQPIISLLGMPVEVLPMALVRPLSGSGAFGVMSAIVAEAPNSYAAFLASTMMGSTETTFYVMAVYFGAVGVSGVRHALIAALLADFTGIVVSCLVSPLFYTASPG